MPTRPLKRPGDEPVTTDTPADPTVVAQAPADAPSTDGTPTTPDAPASADDVEQTRRAAQDAPAEDAPVDEPAAGLEPAWDPEDVEIEGREPALETAQQIAVDLGHAEPDSETTTETEEA
jgi:hypothetical protein